MMKKVLKISLLAAIMIGTSISLSAQKFGFVDSASILAELPDVKQADSSLEGLQKMLQKQLQNKIEAFQKKVTVAEQKVERGELSPVQQQEEAAKLQKEQEEIAASEQGMVKQIQDKRNELLQPIMDKINQAITDVAKENGYQFIFDKQVLLYFEDTQDVSAQVKAKLGMAN